jgi:hypothetical protein
MGRGLSPLQRYILTEAGQRARVYYKDVFQGYFGWKPTREFDRYKPGDTIHSPIGPDRVVVSGDRNDGTLRSPSRHAFSRSEIGLAAYNSGMATLSTACSRLRARGLVESIGGTSAHWSAVTITKAGREWLAAHSVASVPPGEPIIEAKSVTSDQSVPDGVVPAPRRVVRTKRSRKRIKGLNEGQK